MQKKQIQKRSNISELEQKIGYRFSKKSLPKQAITHRSYAVEQTPRVLDNERLEFLGDAVLGLVVSHMLYFRYGSGYKEGDLSRIRAFLVNESQLARQARKLGLASCILLGKGEARCNGSNKDSILADAFEALVGAIYLDGGIEPAFLFIKRWFDDLFDIALDFGLEQDYKTNLQEITQRLYHETPVYEVEQVSGPDHERLFTVALYLRGDMLARATGSSKKEAEQRAAEIAIGKLK
ncbi:MAG: ribonuclease III [Dissulfurimicrobium sp.]